MKIRKFNVGDVFTFVDLLSTISGSAGENLRTLLRSGNPNKEVSDEEAEDRGLELIFYVLNSAYTGAKDKLIEWFASLVEMSVGDFLKEPPEVILDIIEEIGSRKESKDFFSRALQVISGKRSS